MSPVGMSQEEFEALQPGDQVKRVHGIDTYTVVSRSESGVLLSHQREAQNPQEWARVIAEPKPVDRMTASEALFGFVAWLTSYPSEIRIGRRCDSCGFLAELIALYCKANALAEPRGDWIFREADRPNWPVVRPENAHFALAETVIWALAAVPGCYVAVDQSPAIRLALPRAFHPLEVIQIELFDVGRLRALHEADPLYGVTAFVMEKHSWKPAITDEEKARVEELLAATR